MRQINYRKILIRLILSSTLLSSATAIHIQAQTQPTDSANATRTTQAAPSGDELEVCNKRLEKVLADLDKAENSIASKDAEIVKKNELNAAQEKRFQAVLEILKEYALLDNKQKKSFWAKVKDKLAGLIDAATEPETIRAILLTIAVIKAGN